MDRSLIDLLQEPRIFARLTVTAAASAARALADGQRIPIELDGSLYWQTPDGHRVPVIPIRPIVATADPEGSHG